MNESTSSEHQRDDARIPTPKDLSQISVPTRDFSQSKRFFTEVLGGDLQVDGPAVKIQFANFAIALGAQDAGATPPQNEHPHYGFTVPAEVFAALKQRLEAFGVPTHEAWTRTGSTQTLMYFRDPSGNQFELFCPDGDTGLKLRIGHNAGGDYVIPFPSLVYREVKDPTIDPPKIPLLGFNHMTVASKDLKESKRFFTEVLGGKLIHDRPSHVYTKFGNSDIGHGGPMDRGWTEPDAEYPHYTLSVNPEDLVPLKERLDHYGVPTSDIYSRNGTDSAIYFRDPTGNLWELSCTGGFSGSVRRTPSAGGDYVPDVKALCYERWNDPGR